MKKNPYKRVDSENMTDIEKMDRGFNGKTFSINGIDIDFQIFYLKHFYYFAFKRIIMYFLILILKVNQGVKDEKAYNYIRSSNGDGSIVSIR